MTKCLPPSVLYDNFGLEGAIHPDTYSSFVLQSADTSSPAEMRSGVHLGKKLEKSDNAPEKTEGDLHSFATNQLFMLEWRKKEEDDREGRSRLMRPGISSTIWADTIIAWLVTYTEGHPLASYILCFLV